MAHRISSLPLAEYCPLSPALSERHGSGRAAATSTAFHAICAGDPDADAKLAALTDEEREDLAGWVRPPKVDLPGALIGDFDPRKCFWEVEVSLRHPGGSTSLGHVDAYETRSPRLVVVLDVKRSKWTPGATPDSLQLAGYGLALCDELGCDAFLPVIWCALEGQYIWGEVVELDSPKGYELRERCEYAATHEGSPRTGPHCDGCFQSHHCPEYLLPGAIADSNPALAALTSEDPDEQQCLEALNAIQAMETIAKKGKERLKLLARNRGGFHRDGKVWGPGMQKGRVSVSASKAKELLDPETYESICNQGAPFERFVWRNG